MNTTETVSPNPQGKGLTPNLAQLSLLRNIKTVPAKYVEQFSQELFTSLFVLQSEIRFKPVIGQPYWLYRKAGQFRLSMIAPQQWRQEQYGIYIGECMLFQDLTWSLTLSEYCLHNDVFIAELQQLRDNFQRHLQEAETINEMLPVYVQKFSFYPRLYASALSHSLMVSLSKSGSNGLNYRQACLLLDK